MVSAKARVRNRETIIDHVDDGEELKREVERLREKKRELIRADIIARQAKIEVLASKVKHPSILKFMPAGQFLFKPSEGHVIVNESVATMVEGTRMGLVAAGKLPYFGFNHDDGEVSFYPHEFYWKPGINGGVMAAGSWTKNGRDAVEAGLYPYFSPTYFRAGKYPQPIICSFTKDANMGGVCRNPAFPRDKMKVDVNLVR